MGLSEQELCPDPLVPWPILAAAILFTGDPGARFRRAFSPSVMGDIAAGIPVRARSKGRTEMGASQKCGSVFGPATSVVVSSAMLDWEFGGWLDWDPDAKGSNTDFASSSSSKVTAFLSSSLGVL